MAWIVLGLGGAGTQGWSLAIASTLTLAAWAVQMLSQRRRVHRTLFLLLVGGVLWVAAALGLVPLPRAVASLLAPESAALQPEGRTWLPAALMPHEGVYALATGALALGFGATAASLPRRMVQRVPALVLALAAGTTLVAVLHAWTGQEAVFGVIELSAPQMPFFAPFGNANHLATLILLAAPCSLMWTWRQWRSRSALWPLAVVGVLVLAVGWLAAASPGAVLASGGVLVAVLTSRLSRAARITALAASVLAALGAVLVAMRVDPDWAASSPEQRLLQWGDLPVQLMDQPVLGWGVGGFRWAYAPYRTFPGFRTYHTAHSDLLQWCVETGLVGIVALAVIAVWVARQWPAERASQRGLDLGLLGIGLHALGDFPLHVPLLLVSVAGVVGLRLSGVPLPGRVRRDARWPAVLVAGALAAASVVSAHREVVDQASATVWTKKVGDEAAAAAARIEQLAPWRPEPSLHRAWTALDAGQRARAIRIAYAERSRHRAQSRVLLNLSGILLAAGRPDLAEQVAGETLTRDPHEYRAWVVRARAQRALGRRDEALASYRLAVMGWPAETSDGAWVVGEIERLEPGVGWWLRTLEEAPAFWGVYVGDYFREAGDSETAWTAYEIAVRKEPRYRSVLGRIRWLVDAGRLDEALPLALEALASRPEDLSVRATLVRIHRELGDFEDAMEVYREAEGLGLDVTLQILHLTRQWRGPEAALERARSYASAGRLDDETRLLVAELRLETGDAAGCVHDLDELLLEPPPVPEQARVLRARCAESCATCPEPP